MTEWLRYEIVRDDFSVPVTPILEPDYAIAEQNARGWSRDLDCEVSIWRVWTDAEGNRLRDEFRTIIDERTSQP